jgi:hypothetical protein
MDTTPASGKDGFGPAVVALFRAALMKRHSDDWDMETVAEAAYICAEAVQPFIAQSNQQAVQTALEAIGEPPFGGFNIKSDSYDDVIKAIRWYKSAIQAVQTALAGKQKELELKFVEFDPDVVKLISENLHDLF